MINRARPPLRTAHAALAADPAFRQLGEQVDKLLRIQQILASNWPALHLRVMSVREDVITIGVPNAAIAAKCRQLEPSMVRSLIGLHPALVSMRYRPDPSIKPAVAATSRKQPISEQALSTMRDAVAAMSDGPVRDALARLVSSRGRR